VPAIGAGAFLILSGVRPGGLRKVLTDCSSRCVGEQMDIGGAGATQTAGDDRANHETAGHTQATWRKSSWSSFNGNCVEVADLGDQWIGVRDTKDHGVGPILIFGGAAWRSFVDGLRNGRLPL